MELTLRASEGFMAIAQTTPQYKLSLTKFDIDLLLLKIYVIIVKTQ
ncbi:MAG: hypothetical protein HC781_15970 [Leptolyngbyaceae cyanobacterium CSU_1_4]|nr:hypothetical protein [Leptolyngbyaceae cyanobacterium CSU_1_4]